MGSFSLVHWVVLILVVILLFGRGRISDLMGDFAKGINSFKKGLADGDTPASTPTTAPPPQVTNTGTTPVQPVADEVRR
ncbi:twin-arginine translocase TatA/TatE family subunit [Polymorphobacter fuscus]|uniref:Sec-independent protein translocase protein TatA n=1 Tax=Sandarakinorhabdus fusca TaxID=1439888 RepID=A0A7C9GPN9_9SPHN|nr:twin-arginine translocase TatA/TatE family subunit [Polymorphobacter fuscus]KAB7646456.1 twin-arginine translocase TatA/TatE family subunit [Polymorphobacter fuscus]MQT17697.1 twin-arginine translocase TatA/TatE family subunit [Polymorphobacter fuscus]NJC09757.1 sec-independent protein translocase protein TatA [Polymorphobacter fuscus]